MITYRRVPLLRTPFLTGYLAFEVDRENKRVYYATESISRLWLHDVREKYGVEAVKNFWRALRAELEAAVRERKDFVTDPANSVEFTERGRTYERVCEMLGIEPERRTA